MKKNQIKLLLFIVISCFKSNGWAQMATSLYTLRLGDLKAHFHLCTDVGSQIETGVHEWTARFRTYEYDAIQNYHGQVYQTSCIYCDELEDCDFQHEEMLIRSDTSYVGNIVVQLDAWENDPNYLFDEGERCHLRDEDDDNVVKSDRKYLYYRLSTSPSNEVYTEYHFTDSIEKSSSIVCLFPQSDNYLAYSWSVKTTWKYTGASNLITPGCTPQSNSFISGIMPSWSVHLTADVQYYFSTCDGADFDSYLTIYGTDGFTNKASNDNSCGVQSRIEFTPTETGIYYLELRSKSIITPRSGSITYGISTLSNQTCASAITLSHGMSQYYNTLCSSQDAPAQTCGGVNEHHDVWYKFTTPAEGELIIGNCSRNNYNSRISLYRGTCGSLTFVQSSCNDVNCGGDLNGSEVRINSCKNTTYYISVGGIDGARGSGLVFLYFFTNTSSPTIHCPEDIIVEMPEGTCTGTVVNYTTPVGTDNCPGVTTQRIEGMASGSVFPPGYTTNTFKATDADGSTSTCSFNILIHDLERPRIICNPTITINLPSNACRAAVAIGMPTATDNCGVDRIERLTQIPQGGTYPIGTTNIPFAAWDIYNNLATCQTTVVVRDVTPPTISCPSNITVNSAPNQCKTLVGFDSPVVYDNCSATFSLESGIEAGSEFLVGTTTNIYRATDLSGNTATCIMTVTVRDLQKPTITCPPNLETEVVSQTSCRTTVHFQNAIFTDNCPLSITTVSSSIPNGSELNIGNYQVVFTATDYSNNTNTCIMSITVQDKGLPFIVCPENQVLGCPSNFNFPAVNYYDFCSVANMQQIEGPSSGSFFTDAETNLVFKVTDVSGNTNTCSFKVIVQNANPFAGLVLNDVVLSNCGETPPTPIVNTLCSGQITATTSHNFPIYAVGNTNVIWNFDDGNGNQVQLSQLIIVQDNSSPIPEIDNLPIIHAECSAVVTPPIANDHCVGLVTATTSDPLVYSEQGNYTIHWTYSDGNGNYSHQDQTIIIDDVTLPEIPNLPEISFTVCDMILELPTTMDACAGLIVGTTTSVFPLEESEVVIWTFDDGNGNIVYANQSILLEIPNIPGEYLNLISCEMTPCPPGTYCPGGTTEPIACPAGKYQNLEGQAVCISCLAGTFSSTTGSTFCESCPAGKYQGLEGQTSCLNCPKGKYSDATGSIECASCPPGSYSNIIGSSVCASCPAGTYQGQPGQDHCESCLAGTFSSTTGSTYCESCPAGKYQGEEGQTSCLSCPAGKYQNLEGQTFCANCPAGTFSATIGSTFCESCPAGKFQGQEGRTSCLNCPPGSYSSVTGSTFCESCPAGKFQGQEGQTSCLDCPPGSYSNVIGSSVCANCPAGTYQGQQGQDHCESCPPGSFSAQVASVECSSCPAGTYQGQQGQDHCESCGAGTYSNATGAVACTNCPPGKFSASSGSTSCADCPVQTYNPNSGASECLNCPAGTYNPNTGAIICPDCMLSLNCPSPSIVNTNEGFCYASSINLIEPILTNSCPISSLVSNAPLNYPVGSTVVTWTATDVSGVTATCQQTVTVNKYGDASLLYAYTILSKDEVKMKENIVESGGIGVMTANKKVSLEKNSKIIGTNTFVKSGNIDVKSGSTVTTKIDAYVPSSLKPPFIENVNPGNSDVKINDNSAPVTLNLSNYGKIEVGKNVVATLSGHANVNIKELKLGEGSQLKFNQATNVMIDKKLDGNDFIKINENVTPGIQFYVEEEVKFNKSSIVKANIYTKKEIKIEKSTAASRTYMTGQFIADKVDAGEYVTWNWDPTYCPEFNQSMPIKVSQMDFSQPQEENNSEQNLSGEFELQLFPNPAKQIIHLKVTSKKDDMVKLQLYNVKADVLKVMVLPINQFDNNIIPIDLQNYPDGLYFVKVILQDKTMVKSFTILK